MGRWHLGEGRISGFKPRGNTRMRASIRLLGRLLRDVEAHTKLLETLSDGKPEGYDGQHLEEYGIEGTRQALFQARLQGIRPFSITIDEVARDYHCPAYARCRELRGLDGYRRSSLPCGRRVSVPYLATSRIWYALLLALECRYGC